MNNDLMIRSIYIDWDKIESDSYLRNIEAIRDKDRIDFHAQATILTGENGSGKSTLLEAVAVAYGFNPEGGSRNYSFSTYDSHSELSNAVTLSKGYRNRNGWGYFLRAESFYNVATAEEEYSKDTAKGPMYYHRRSHGESFLALAQENFRSRGLYLLDEPEAALSPRRQMTLLAMIMESIKLGSQFMIATHSPILSGIPDAELWSFDGPLHTCTYEETDAYTVTKMFIDRREQVLKYLLDEDSEDI
ncbi:MAG: AAA family ATPase [Erysipelotrichaceae bacterium]|nr:AAA family ATPase [Erysipelotrichaceae bacterium]